MLKIDIVDVSVNERSGTNERGAWHSREQTAWVHLFERSGQPQPHPQRLVIRLDDGQPPYPVGKYELSPQSFYLGDFASLRVFPRLKPLAVQAAPARQAA